MVITRAVLKRPLAKGGTAERGVDDDTSRLGCSWLFESTLLYGSSTWSFFGRCLEPVTLIVLRAQFKKDRSLQGKDRLGGSSELKDF